LRSNESRLLIKARESGTEANTRTSSLALLKGRLLEKDREVADLEENLAAADGGSLFDLSAKASMPLLRS
jgi:hypothetical protein